MIDQHSSVVTSESDDATVARCFPVSSLFILLDKANLRSAAFVLSSVHDDDDDDDDDDLSCVTIEREREKKRGEEYRSSW